MMTDNPESRSIPGTGWRPGTTEGSIHRLRGWIDSSENQKIDIRLTQKSVQQPNGIPPVIRVHGPGMRSCRTQVASAKTIGERQVTEIADDPAFRRLKHPADR